MKTIWLMLPALLLPLACGEEQEPLPGVEVGCAWFEEENCYRSSLDDFTPCLPTAQETGQLSADGKSCTYDSGHRVVFTDPVELTAQAMRGKLWDFRLELGGDFCMAFRQTDENTMLVESGLGVFRVEGSRAGLAIACPDGNLYKVSDRDLLLTCENPDKILPAFTVLWDETGVGFRMAGTGGASLLTFNCRAP